MSNKINVYVLVNGAEVVGEQVSVAVSEDSPISNHYVVKKPHQIQVYAGDDGHAKVQFIPFKFTLFAKTDEVCIPLYRKDVMFVDEANEELQEFYKRSTSPIIQPTKSGLIL